MKERTIRVFVFFIIFLLSLHSFAADNSGAAGNLKTYNSYKSDYLKAILANDERAQKESLAKIVEISKELGLDAKEYEAELQRLKAQGVADKEPSLNLSPKPDGSKRKLSCDAPAGLNVVQKIEVEGSTIKILISSPITKEEIKFLKLKTNSSFKEVIDFPGIWPRPLESISQTILKDIRIAQFDARTVRLVLENDQPIEADFRVEESKLIVTLGKKLTSETKTIQSPAPEPVLKIPKTATSSLLQGKVIVIDAGHGGKDPGAIGYRQKEEKEAVLEIAKRTHEELKKRGCKVYMTRNADEFIKLKQRTQLANEKNADLFISIHANAPHSKSQYLSYKGIETYFLSPARSERAKNVAALENREEMEDMDYYGKEIFLNFLNREKIIASNKLAIDLQKHILSSLRGHFGGVEDGGVKEAPFWVLVGAQMPAVLIEVGYITNPTEGERLFNPLYQELLAKGIVDGVEAYFSKN